MSVDLKRGKKMINFMGHCMWLSIKVGVGGLLLTFAVAAVTTIPGLLISLVEWARKPRGSNV